MPARELAGGRHSCTYEKIAGFPRSVVRGVQKLRRWSLLRWRRYASILSGMVPGFFPLRYFIAALAVWLNRQQQEVIDDLKEENRLLKERLNDRKLHFTDAERRRLAARAKLLGRKILAQLNTLVTPDTLLRWLRGLIAQKLNHVQTRKRGRPRTKDEIVALILRMARENSGWGYTRIVGALSKLVTRSAEARSPTASN